MSRKSKEISKDLQSQLSKLKEIEELLERANKEEESLTQNATDQINQICSSGGFFCGVVLTKEDLFKIISIMIDTKENIKIPFNLYYKE